VTRLQLTRGAVRDLQRLRAFIAEHNPATAARVSRRLVTSLEQLVAHPELGHPVEELPDVRERVRGDYGVRYTRTAQAVLVLRIWRGKDDR